jgi:hypothetical protein
MFIPSEWYWVNGNYIPPPSNGSIRRIKNRDRPQERPVELVQAGVASALHGSRKELNLLFGNLTNDAFSFSPPKPDREERRASAR